MKAFRIMIDYTKLRTDAEADAVIEFPQEYGEGILKGIEIYESAFKYEYVATVCQKNYYRGGSVNKGYAYYCGVWEGWHEAQDNDVVTVPEETVYCQCIECECAQTITPLCGCCGEQIQRNYQ